MNSNNNEIDNQVKVIRGSGLFDEKYYLSQNKDVAKAKVDPIEHYCKFGWSENRNPSEFFNTRFYLENNVDVNIAELNPFYHYILFGKKEGRLPNGKFLKRIFFHSSALTIFPPKAEISFTNGTPPSAKSTLSNLKNTHVLTENKGNMIHAEAPLKIFSYDHYYSVTADLFNVYRHYKSNFKEVMHENFDLIILSLDNFIRVGTAQDLFLLGLLEALKAADMEFFVFGAGMQDPLPPDLKLLSEPIQNLLRYFNDNARLFSVRGLSTQKWLKQVGLTNSTVNGCPSLFVYPLRMLSVPGVESIQGKKILTAGHIFEHYLNGNWVIVKRGHEIIEVMKGLKADYLFQSEPFSFNDLKDTPLIYDDAIGELNAKLINDYILKKVSIQLPFNRYFMFHEASAWRQACRNYDIFIGDRFHGGITALQAGTPALFIISDQRVEELADYFALPNTTFQEIRTLGMNSVVKKHLSDKNMEIFRSTYLNRLKSFRESVTKTGLELAIEPEIISALNTQKSN